MAKYKEAVGIGKYSPVVHFEMPYADKDRLAGFYANAFGWKMEKLGKDMGNYVTAATAETGADRMVKTPGTINGGFYPKESGAPLEPSVVIAVESLEAAMKKVEGAGGKLIGKPMDIPGVGKYIPFKDSEGNRVGMLQPKKM